MRTGQGQILEMRGPILEEVDADGEVLGSIEGSEIDNGWEEALSFSFELSLLDYMPWSFHREKTV